MLIALLIPLGLAALVLSWLLFRAAAARDELKPRGEDVLVGGVTNFFDTLGIGSFAPTLAWFKLRGRVPDRFIPCTMIVSHTLPTMLQALIFLWLLGVHVDPVLLIGSALAFLMGGLLGAPLVARTRKWIVQAVIGCALLAAASLYALANLDLMPVGGVAASLPPMLTIAAIVASFAMGILINFGVGNYAPSLIMFSLMGLDPRLAFPIMAVGAGMTMIGVSAGHIKGSSVDLRTAVSFALGGIPAVLIAAYIVKSLPLLWLRWLVIVVVIYAGLVLLYEAARGRREPAAEEAGTKGVGAADPD